MENKPYYEQEYHEEETDVPEPTFWQVFKLLFTAPFKWHARSTRKGFWLAYVITIVLTLILAACSGFSFASDNQVVTYSENTMKVFLEATTTTKIIQVIVVVLLIWIILGLLGFTIRRLHDSNHSGWWYWILVVPFGQLILLYFLVLPTVEKPVRWGGYLFKEKE